MFHLECDVIVEKRHPYRTAFVTNRFFFFHYDRGDAVDKFRESLGKVDNHICYTLKKRDGITLYVQFSDWTMYVGTEITEKDW